MKAKLLHKTLRFYLYYAVILFVIASPVFYFVIQQLYQREADDTLQLHRNEFVINVLPNFSQNDVVNWNKFNRNIQLIPINTFQNDTFFTTNYYDSLEAELEPYRVLNSTIVLDGKFYQFSSKFNLVENEDIIRNIFLLFLGILLLLVLGILIITKIISVSLWKPFYSALDQIEAFEIDKRFTYTEIKSSVAEFDRLNNSVKKLIEKNLDIYQNQKEFIENAAHELQTPLAVFKAKVDALMQYPDLKEEHYVIINSIHDNVSKLFRINKNLLLLSKIENNSYQQSESISLIGALSKNIEFFKEQAVTKQIQIETFYASDITLNANTVLLDILISNLFLNAIKYSLENGFIRISIANNILYFDNTGIDKALPKELLFKRFSMQNVGENSSGLGLSIIKKITDLYRWTIDYQYKDGYHQFQVRF